MKKIIYLFSFLLCLISVSAFYGGESQLIETIEDCDTFFVSVTANGIIDDGEYWFNFNNCNQIKTNFWECKCNNNAFDLILNTQINTLNFYNFSIMNLGDIQIENENVIIKSVSYTNSILELELEGEGTVNVSIDTGSLGKPNNVYVNDVSVPFEYIDGKVIFEAHFSTNIVKLDYYTAPSTTTGGGGGGPGPTKTPSIVITPPTPEEPKVEILEGEKPAVATPTPEGVTRPTGLAAITGAVVGALGTGGAIVALILAIGGVGAGSYFLVRKKKK